MIGARRCRSTSLQAVPALEHIADPETTQPAIAELSRRRDMFHLDQSGRQRTGGEHCRQPVLSMVCQASMALCLSIRLRVSGIG